MSEKILITDPMLELANSVQAVADLITEAYEIYCNTLGLEPNGELWNNYEGLDKVYFGDNASVMSYAQEYNDYVNYSIESSTPIPSYASGFTSRVAALQSLYSTLHDYIVYSYQRLTGQDDDIKQSLKDAIAYLKEND